MKSPVPTLVSWSSGKNSAWALHRLAQDERYPYLWIVNYHQQQALSIDVAMHLARDAKCWRRRLLHLACRYGSFHCRGRALIASMKRPCKKPATRQSPTESGRLLSAIFLEDIRKYREDSLRDSGLTPLFPIWGTDTRLLPEMIAAGLKARIVLPRPEQNASRVCRTRSG